jgi:glycosyltransferase involved in cell wall biosynthesis
MTPPPATTRILSVFNKYLERGGEEVVVEQIRNVLEANSEWFIHRELLFESADWKRPPVPSVWKKALWFMRNPKSLARLREAHTGIQADCWLTHNIFPVGSAAIYREASQLGVPIVQYIHNFRPFSVNGYLWDGERLALGGLRRSYWQEIRAGAWQDSQIKTAGFAMALHAMHGLGWWSSVRTWIAISEFMRQRFIEGGIPAERIFTLRTFYQPQAIVPVAPRDDRYVLFLGRMISAKGVRVLLEVWSQLEARFGTDIPELRLAGDGPLSAWVASEARRYRRVRYLGRIDGAEKASQLTGCLAVVAPSLWWEPLGQVIYEAFNYAKPVLAARSGGMPELVTDGVTGCLHEPAAIHQLANQVMSLDAAPAQAAEMGQRGRAWLEANTRVEDWQTGFRQIVAIATGRAEIRTDAPPPFR